MTVYFTPLDYASPIPGDTTDPYRPLQDRSCVDYDQKRIYQWHLKDRITLGPGDPLYEFYEENPSHYSGFARQTTMYTSAELVIFDMDTLVEISRVEPDFSWFLSEQTDTDATADFYANGFAPHSLTHKCFRPGAHLPDWINKSVAIPGTDWVVAPIYTLVEYRGAIGWHNNSSSPKVSPDIDLEQKYIVVNATTGGMSVYHVPCVWFANPPDIYNRYLSTPMPDFYVGHINNIEHINETGTYDVEIRPLCAAPVSGSQTVIISKEEVNSGSAFFLRSQLIDNSTGNLSFVDTEPDLSGFDADPALITWGSFHGICTGSTGSGADFYMLTTLLNSDGQTFTVVKVVADALGALSSSVLATITESDFVDGGSINYAGGFVFVNYTVGGSSKIKKIDASSGSVAATSTTVGNGMGVTLPQAYADLKTAGYPAFAQFPTEGNYLLGVSGNAEDFYENRFYKIDTSTLAESEWPVFIGEQAGLDTLDSTGLIPYGFFDDARSGIFYPQDLRVGLNPNEWVFVSAAPPEPPDPEGEDSIATILETMGEFTGILRAITIQPCPIVGQGTGKCLTGRASWSPGIGQVLSGRDDVDLPCD